ISGINSASIIAQLMQIESRPVTQLQSRIDVANQQKLAFTDLMTRLTSLNVHATSLTKPSTFNNAVVHSSNSDVLSATASPSAQPGSYQFQVARTVTTQQLITNGFADSNNATVGASKLTITAGDGPLRQQRLLSNLNGGAGVNSGSFKITDKTGHSAT